MPSTVCLYTMGRDLTNHVDILLILLALMVERHEVSGQSPVKLLILRVQHEEDEVKSTEEGVRQLDVLHYCGPLVPLGHARVGCCQDGGSGIEGTDDSCLGYGQSLLLLEGEKCGIH